MSIKKLFANKVAFLDCTTATNSSNLLKIANGIAEISKQTKISEDFMLSVISIIQERSRKAPESVARALKGILLDVQKVTTDKSEDGIKAVAKLEKELSRFDLSLKLNVTTFKSNEAIITLLMSRWGSFNDEIKRTIQSMLGGKNFSEEFNIIMNSYNAILGRINDLKNVGKQ